MVENADSKKADLKCTIPLIFYIFRSEMLHFLTIIGPICNILMISNIPRMSE